jgi:trimeric autotransporter adhesin
MSKGAIVLSAIPHVVGGTLGQQIEHDQDKNIIIYCGTGTAGGLGVLTNFANISHTHGTPTIIGSLSISSSSNAWTISIPDFLTTAALTNHSHGSVSTVTIAGSNLTLSSASSGLTLGIPNWITTAPSLTHTHNYAGTGTTITGGFMTLNSNGLELNITGGGGCADGYNIIAAGTQTGNSAGTVLFSNSNGVSFGMSGGTRITASYSQSTHEHSTLGYAFSTHTHGSISLALDGLSGSFASLSNGLTLSLTNSTHVHPYAGTQTSATNVGLSVNSDGISVSIDTAGLSALGDGVNIIAAGSVTAGTVQTVLFNDSNGISFGMDTDSTAITASHNAYSATSMFSASFLNTAEPHIRQIIVSDSTYSSGTLNIVGSNNITASYNGSSVIISGANTHAQQTGISAVAVSDTTYTAGSVSFVNGNNISFGSSGANEISASISFPAQTYQPLWYSASGEEFSSNTIEFANTNGVTFLLTNGSIGATVKTDYLTSQTVQPIAISDSAISFTYNTLSLGTENGLTLYLSNSSLVGLYTVPTQTNQPRIVSLNGTTGNISLSGSRNVTVESLNGSTISIIGPENILNSFSVGGNTGTTGSSAISGGGFVIAGGSNITLSQSNNSISIHGTGGIQLGASDTTYVSGTVVMSAGSNVTIGTTENAGVQYIKIDAAGGTATGGADGYNILAAGSQTASTATTVLFSNANGVSFGMSNNTITASIASSLAGIGYTTSTHTGTNLEGTHDSLGLSMLVPRWNTRTDYAGTLTSITGASASLNTNGLSLNIPQGSLYYIDGNGVSWSASSTGLSTSIYASVGTVTGGGLASINYSASGTSTSTGTLVFGNTNGVSFSIRNNSLVATVATNYAASVHTHSQYLTTAMQSASSSVFAKTGFSSITTVGTAIVATLNTNGLSAGIPQFLTTGMPYQSSTRFIGLNTAQTNVDWTVNSSGISINALRYARTGATITTTSGSLMAATLNTSGLYLAVPAYLTSGAGGGTNFTTVTRSGSLMSGTMNTSGLTLAVPAFLTTGLGTSDIGDVQFVDSLGSNLTWGSSTSGNTTYIFGTAGGDTAGGIGSFYLSGNTLGNTTASGTAIQLYAGNNISISGINNSVIRLDVPDNAGSLYFTDGSGVSFGIISDTNSNTTVSGSVATGSVYFDNAAGSNFTWGSSTSANSTWIYGTAGGGTGGAGALSVSASGSSGTFNAISFLNTNNVSFGMSGNTITASVSPVVNMSISAFGSNGTYNALSFGNGGNISFGLSGSTLTGSVPNNIGSLGFSDSNGIVFGVATTASNSSTVVTASYAGIWSLQESGGSTAGTASSSFGSILNIVAGSGITLSGGSGGITVLASRLWV